MHILNLVTQTMFDDQFLWPYGFPVRVEQSGGASVSVELNMGDARPTLIDEFLGQWGSPFDALRPLRDQANRELYLRVMIVKVRVDLFVNVSADVFPHIDRTNIKES